MVIWDVLKPRTESEADFFLSPSDPRVSISTTKVDGLWLLVVPINGLSATLRRALKYDMSWLWMFKLNQQRPKRGNTVVRNLFPLLRCPQLDSTWSCVRGKFCTIMRGSLGICTSSTQNMQNAQVSRLWRPFYKKKVFRRFPNPRKCRHAVKSKVTHNPYGYSEDNDNIIMRCSNIQSAARHRTNIADWMTMLIIIFNN